MRWKLALLLVLALPFVAAQDIVVWQGQYYEGTTFHAGTYGFNFTIYDAKTGGDPCFSNQTTLTTGSLGEWRIEQSSVGAACSNSSKTYYLEIMIEGEVQDDRRLIKNFDYLRKDTWERVSYPMTFEDAIYGDSELRIVADTINTSLNKTGFVRNIIRNLDASPETATIYTLENNGAYQFSMALGSTNYNLTGNNKNNVGAISLNAPGVMEFLIRYRQPFIWRVNPADDGVLLNQTEVMRLDPDGNLSVAGHIYTNKSINATGNVSASYFVGDGSRLTGISTNASAGSTWNITGSNYLINNSGILGMNETALNATIRNASSIYNDSAYIASVNTTLTTQISALGQNSTFNQTLTDALYAPKIWNYNETTIANTYTDTRITNNNASWMSTYNATYAANNANNTWNQTLANLLYTPILWNYNQTAAAATYADGRFLNRSGTNANQNIQITPYNLTAASGLFTYVGSAASRVTTLFAQNIDANNNIVATNNVSAKGYIANNVAGITIGTLQVCESVLIAACTSWCTLQIEGGIITGCT